jgi:hypothetical protein
LRIRTEDLLITQHGREIIRNLRIQNSITRFEDRRQNSIPNSTLVEIETPLSNIHPFFANRRERRKWFALGHLIPEKTIVLNKWQGQVIDVTETSFTAALYDLNKTDIVEQAEFAINEVSSEDTRLIRSGAVFYWYILQHDTRTGDRDQMSRIWFQRSGRMSREIHEAAQERVNDVWRSFGWGP